MIGLLSNTSAYVREVLNHPTYFTNERNSFIWREKDFALHSRVRSHMKSGWRKCEFGGKAEISTVNIN